VDLLSIVVSFAYGVVEQQNIPVLLSTGQREKRWQEDRVTVCIEGHCVSAQSSRSI
jgi:hypothetical protein